MTGLRLALTMQDAKPALPPSGGARLTAQAWHGGAATGGTLDPALRGQPAGPSRWCLLSDLNGDTGDEPDGAWLLEQINPGDLTSPEGAAALLVVTMDIAAAVEEEFNDWYDTEHMPLLRAVPGVICARRYRTLRGAPRYAAVYHLDGTNPYASLPWRQADQTPWLQRLRRFQSNRHYSMFYPGAA